jgi:two-component system, LuxR family, response regulator FixJ
MFDISVIASESGEREAIASLLSRVGCPVAGFPDLASFLARSDSSRLGCLVLDLPDDAIASIPQLRETAELLPTIVLSPCADVGSAVQVMKEGAADFLSKPIDEARLVSAVRDALGTSLERMERARRKRELLERYESLTAREKEVIVAIQGGSANREIARQLGISARTVEIHRAKAMAKLGARTLPDLVRFCLDLTEH